MSEFLQLPFFQGQTFEDIISFMSTSKKFKNLAEESKLFFRNHSKLTEIFHRHDLDQDKSLNVEEFKKLPFFLEPQEEDRNLPNQTATENTHDTTTSSCVANSSETHTGNPVAAGRRHPDETSVEYVGKRGQ